MMKYYTVKQTAAVLNLTPYTVRQYLRDGVIKGSKLKAGWRVSEENLIEYLEGKHGKQAG